MPGNGAPRFWLPSEQNLGLDAETLISSTVSVERFPFQEAVGDLDLHIESVPVVIETEEDLGHIT